MPRCLSALHPGRFASAVALTFTFAALLPSVALARNGSGAEAQPEAQAKVQPETEAEDTPATIAEHVADMETYEGFLRLHVDHDAGSILLELPAAPGTDGGPPAGVRARDAGTRLEAIHVSGIRTGLGSNPVGLDRGQLGATRVVRFREVGGRVLLEQRNLDYRALSEDDAERAAVAESFADSVLWSGEIAVRDPDGRLLVDISEFLKKDLHGISGTLKRSGQGSFSLDGDRSVVESRATLAFPDNCELEALLTFTSDEPGRLVRETAAEPTSPSFVLHHSFVRLPDDGYRPRAFDPRVSAFATRFLDYAADLDEPIERAYIARHRLQKVNPRAETSPVVEPIVFHVDPGAPEPIRSALIEGAGWWAEAFERAGFQDAYRVEVLPPDAHPMDVRYNVIQWVHRSTRGWSYGASVVDPRTGEILKGHVSLGSLRVRQDRLLFEGLAGTSASGTGRADDPVQLALARIRQLAAHEVGHALGFAHNFAASTQDRASVMDYPAPLIRVRGNRLDFSQAYDTGIGEWDIHAVNWAYREFRPGDVRSEAEQLEQLVADARRRGLRFLSDADARGNAAAHPYASLWDNGEDPVVALREAMDVRAIGIAGFALDRLHEGRPIAHLQEVFVPVYLHHRFQLEAAAKLLGGVDYAHALRDGTLRVATPVEGARQMAALDAILDTLEPSFLDIPESIVRVLLPRPFGEGRNREMFPSRTGPTTDPIAAASAAADVALMAILHPARTARLAQQPRRDPGLPGWDFVLAELLARQFPSGADDAAVRARGSEDARYAALRRAVQRQIIQRLIELAQGGDTAPDVRAWTNDALRRLGVELAARRVPGVPAWHGVDLASLITRHLERPFDTPAPLRATEPTPPGSPIGGGMPGHLCGCSQG